MIDSMLRLSRTDDLRFRLPVANDPYTGTHQATSFGQSCPQQAFSADLPSQVLSDVVSDVVNEFFTIVTPNGEDCTFICPSL